MFSITPDAIGKVEKLMQRDGQPGDCLRVGVQGGGCTGYSYVVKFDKKRETDVVLDTGSFLVLCDPKSYEFLENVEVYYDTNLLGGGIKIRNPDAARSCSCGESFAVRKNKR